MLILVDDEAAMIMAIAEAEGARGSTGDNPWVGSVVTLGREVVGRGRTQGPGEDHAEIGALREARQLGVDLARATLYSTLEPCSFHGRTPACAKVIAESGVQRMVTGIRDPNPRVNGAGIAIVRAAGVAVTEGVCDAAIVRQLGVWIVRYYPHEPLRRALAIRNFGRVGIAQAIAEMYAIDLAAADEISGRALTSPP